MGERYQVHKAGETDVSHKDYVISWRGASEASIASAVMRGSTLYTPDLTTCASWPDQSAGNEGVAGCRGKESAVV